jgi:hypothetical protein
LAATPDPAFAAPLQHSLLLRIRHQLRNISDAQWNTAYALLILGLFVTFHKGAFQSYFSADDFSNLADFGPWWGLWKLMFGLTLLGPYRPMGVMFYKAMGPLAGFHFAPYVIVLQALHLATGSMLWLFLRRLGLRPGPAALGAAFFVLHMSTLPAYWKPMYVFDVLCAFWVILALLLYQRGRFFLSLLCAWLAFKSKEMELMLPVVLLLYEWFFGREKNAGKLRWQPLVPFFLVSLLFGLQALQTPPGPESGYTLHLTASNIWTAIAFYSGKLLYAPFSGLVVSIGLLFLRQRLITWGILSFWITLIVMFGFPARESGAYLYVPMVFFAVAVAAVAQSRPWWAVLFLVLWIPASYERLLSERKPLIAYHYEHLPYVNQVLQSLADHPRVGIVIFEGTPADFEIWGQHGLFPFALHRWDLPVYPASDPNAPKLIRRPDAYLFTWDNVRLHLSTTTYPADGRELSYVDFSRDNPFWQMKIGWKPLAGGCRWIALRSIITLRQPAGEQFFSLRVDVPPDQAELTQPALRVTANGQTIGEHRLDQPGLQTFTWPISAAAATVRDFEIAVDRATTIGVFDGLGAQVCACGIVPPGASQQNPSSTSQQNPPSN